MDRGGEGWGTERIELIDIAASTAIAQLCNQSASQVTRSKPGNRLSMGLAVDTQWRLIVTDSKQSPTSSTWRSDMSDQDLNAIQYHGMRPRCGVVAVRRNDIDGHEVCVIDKTPDPLTSENLVLDKQGDTWVLTYKPKHKPVVLRLKIRHCCVWDRDDFIAEVLNQSDDRFRWIHEFSVDSAYVVADDTVSDKDVAGRVADAA